MLQEEKALPPEHLMDRTDFQLESLCDSCPLRQAEYEGFWPAYGVQVGSGAEKTLINVISFEVLYEQTRNRLRAEKPMYRAVLSVGNVAAFEVEAAFKGCESASVLPRTIRPDKVICTALNRVLTGKVPNSRNLSVGHVY